MHIKLIETRALAVLGSVLLIACSSDPAARKTRYLHSGESYFAKARFRAAEVEFRNAVAIDPRFEAAHFRLAETYLKLAEYGSARREMEATVALNPGNVEAQTQLTGMFLVSQEYLQAQQLAQKLLAADQTNARAREMLGAANYAVRDIPGAIQELRKAIEIAPRRVNSYLNLAAIYVSTNQPEEAEAIYKKAIESSSESSLAHTALGQFYFSSARIPQAEEELKSAVKLNPQGLVPRLALVPVYLTTGRMSDAERVCRDLKAMEPDAPKAYRALGLLYLLTDQTDKAVAEFHATLASHPKDARVRAALIDLLLNEGRLVEAEPLNKELLKASPNDPDGLVFDARMLIAQGKYQQAQGEIEEALKIDMKSAAGHYFLGVVQNALGFDKEAQSSWTRALELNPQFTVARVALADSAANHGDWDGALRVTLEMLKAHPTLISAQLIRARSLIGKGNSQEAESILQAVLDRDPASLQALSILVNLRVREDKSQSLIPVISKAIRAQGQNAGLYYWLGAAYFSSNDFKGAEEAIKRAIVLDPKRWEAYRLLARIHVAQGATEQAKKDLRDELERNQQDAEGYAALETFYEKEGNWEEARKLVEKAHQLNPTDSVITNNLAYLYLEHGGDVNYAVSLARDARQKSPGAPYTADTLGWAYYKLGSTGAAVTQLTEAVQMAPRNARYHYHLGMAYLASGRAALARQSLQRALAIDPNFPDAANARAALDRAARQQSVARK